MIHRINFDQQSTCERQFNYPAISSTAISSTAIPSTSISYDTSASSAATFAGEITLGPLILPSTGVRIASVTHSRAAKKHKAGSRARRMLASTKSLGKRTLGGLRWCKQYNVLDTGHVWNPFETRLLRMLYSDHLGFHDQQTLPPTLDQSLKYIVESWDGWVATSRQMGDSVLHGMIRAKSEVFDSHMSNISIHRYVMFYSYLCNVCVRVYLFIVIAAT